MNRRIIRVALWAVSFLLALPLSVGLAQTPDKQGTKPTPPKSPDSSGKVAPTPVVNSAVPKIEYPAETMRKALEQTLALEFNEQPLNLAVAQLKEQTKLNFILDKVTLEQIGIGLEEPVSFKVPKVKLRNGLRMLLNQYNLGYAILDDTIVITTADMAIRRQLGQPVNLDLQGTPLLSALKQLARETATNLVMDTKLIKESQTPVTMQLDDVPLDTAVRLMAEMAGVKSVRLGNVLYITTEARADKLRAEEAENHPVQPQANVPQPGMGLGGGGGAIGGGGGAPGGAPPAPPNNGGPKEKEEKKDNSMGFWQRRAIPGMSLASAKRMLNHRG